MESFLIEQKKYFGPFRSEDGSLFSIGRWNEELFFMDYAARTHTRLEVQGPGRFLPSSNPQIRRILVSESGQLTVESQDGGAVHAERILYHAEEVSFHNGDIHLSGTLYLPEGPGPYPAVVLVHGSGPETRYGMGQYPYFFLSHGYAVLTYDKRGSGQSDGDYQPWSAGIRVLAGDAQVGVGLLSHRSEIRYDQIGLMGISNGAWVTIHATALLPRLAFSILMVGGGIPIWLAELHRISADVRQMGVDESMVAEAAVVMGRVFAFLAHPNADPLHGKERFETLLTYARSRPWFEATSLVNFADLPIDTLIQIGTAAWANELSYDPTEDLGRIDSRILAILGEQDNQVPTPEILVGLASCIPQPELHRYVVLPGANHYFHVGKNEFAEGLFETLGIWLDEQKNLA